MKEYEYWTEETEIMEYTSELKDILNCNETYRTIFRCFKEKNMPALAANMVQMIRTAKELKRRVSERENNIEYLKKQIAEKESKISSLTSELEKIKAYKIGEDIEKLEVMANCYDRGQSLRKIGQRFNMDKSTVKRKLIKLGYTFDENGIGKKP